MATSNIRTLWLRLGVSSGLELWDLFRWYWWVYRFSNTATVFEGHNLAACKSFAVQSVSVHVWTSYIQLITLTAYGKLHNNKHGNNPTDYTSFHAASQHYGKDRSTWSPLLFQIQKASAHMQMPTAFMRHDNQIVLDPWDHGVRDFPELPGVLSSALEGYDVEMFMRSNLAIALYDILGMWYRCRRKYTTDW